MNAAGKVNPSGAPVKELLEAHRALARAERLMAKNTTRFATAVRGALAVGLTEGHIARITGRTRRSIRAVLGERDD